MRILYYSRLMLLLLSIWQQNTTKHTLIYWKIMAQKVPLSCQAAIAHKPRQVRWGELHAPVVTNTPFTQGLRPLCLPCATTKLSRSPLKAEGRQNGCLGRSRVVHRTFRHRHGRHGRREVLSMFKTVAQRSPRRSVAHRSLKGGRMKAHTSPWSQNGCTVVGHWSPS